MRIVFVIYSLGGGGAERVTTVLAQHWADIGHTVKVVTFANETANFFQLNHNVEYESLHYPGIGSTVWKTTILNVSRILILRKTLRAFRPDVVIGIMSTISAVVALACIGLPCRAIGTEHTYAPMASLSPFRHFIRGLSYRFLDAVVVLTKESAQWIRKHTAAKTVCVIPNPLVWPLVRGKPLLSPEEACHPGRLIILAVGRLSPEKGFIDLLEVFAKIYLDSPSWDLVILGDGPDRKILEMRTQQLGLETRVFLPGKVGNIGDWYLRASIFAMTSLFEGFPNALLEAMAYGLAVISTDCDTGPRDIIEHNVNGFLAAPGDPIAFARGLKQFIDDQGLRSRLSENARGVVERYDVGRITQRWSSVFDAIGIDEPLDQPPSRSPITCG